jgi:hypothetical protein
MVAMLLPDETVAHIKRRVGNNKARLDWALMKAVDKALREMSAQQRKEFHRKLQLKRSGPRRPARPPGARIMLRVARVLFTRKKMSRVVAPIVGDYRYEYEEARKSGRLKRVHVIAIHWWGFLRACGLDAALSAVATIIEKIAGP